MKIQPGTLLFNYPSGTIARVRAVNYNKNLMVVNLYDDKKHPAMDFLDSSEWVILNQPYEKFGHACFN